MPNKITIRNRNIYEQVRDTVFQFGSCGGRGGSCGGRSFSFCGTSCCPEAALPCGG